MNSEELKSKTPNIHLIGCAKNEAAYIPEWIFHHLDIGFSSIKIYVNDTDDNSIEVLNKIIKHHPQVSYCVADELISQPPEEYEAKTNSNFYNTNKVQSIIYTDALCTTEKQTTEYIAFLDVDEFFLPQKPLNEIFSLDIKNELPKRFHWLLLSGDKYEFSSLAKCSKGYIDSSFKSIVPNRNVEIRAEDPHRFSINGDIGAICNDAVVLHRVLRSQKEYLCLLAKSTSNDKNRLTNGFKRNRRGWTTRGKVINKYMAQLNANSYEQNFSKFIELCGISADLKIARNGILNKHTLIVDNLASMNQQNIDLTRSLLGSGVEHIDVSKTVMFSLFWKTLGMLSPRMVLSHETIKDALLSKIRGNKKHN
jgi:hypothetical protein